MLSYADHGDRVFATLKWLQYFCKITSDPTKTLSCDRSPSRSKPGAWQKLFIVIVLSKTVGFTQLNALAYPLDLLYGYLHNILVNLYCPPSTAMHRHTKSVHALILKSCGTRSHLLQCFKVLYHSWISQCSYSLIPNANPLVFIPLKTSSEELVRVNNSEH